MPITPDRQERKGPWHIQTTLQHRVLVIYEGGGIQGDFANYLVRSLLSEGRIRYVPVEKTKEGERA